MFSLLLSIQVVKKVDEDNLWDDDVAFLKFYAPWCGHCKALAPIFLELSEVYHEQGIVFGEVNCVQERRLCYGKYGLNGFPHLYLHLHGKETEYEGGRQVSDFINWLNAHLREGVELMNEEQILRLTKERKQDAYFVVHTNTEKNEYLEEWRSKINLYALKEDGPVTFESVRDNVHYQFEGDLWEKEQLEEFINENMLSNFPDLTQEAYIILKNKNISTIVIDPANETQLGYANDIRQEIIKMKKTDKFYYDYFNPAWMNGTHWDKYVETFGHNTSDYPLLLTVVPSDESKFWSKRVDTNSEVSVKDQYFNFIKGIMDGSIAAQSKEKEEL